MYAADVPFIEKWRQAMRYLDEDADSGYQKIWLEMQAMALERPPAVPNACRACTAAGGRRQAGLRGRPAELGVDPSLPDGRRRVTGVTFNQGIMLERLPAWTPAIVSCSA